MPPRNPKLTNQIKGLLLEEAILYLLRKNGYRPVTSEIGDPTLGRVSAGLQVRGRGGEHQIDAIADYLIRPPFSYPLRLLVEAKAYSSEPIDLGIIRNALAVFKDVSEYFTAPQGTRVPQRRYHYRYAIFSTSRFSEPAQRFAYAHDIHLFPLTESNRARVIKRGVEVSARKLATLNANRRGRNEEPYTLRELRVHVRSVLLGSGNPLDLPLAERQAISEALEDLLGACREIGSAYLAVAGGIFPLFLIPAPGVSAGSFASHLIVRIRKDKGGWYIEDVGEHKRLFSFEIPAEMLRLYEESGTLTRRAALEMKAAMLADLQIFVMDEDGPRIISIVTDSDWLAALRSEIVNR